MSGLVRPAVDEGDPPGILAVLRHELAPSPDRLGNTLRLVALVTITVTISETFRMPEPALSAYVVLFVSRSERASTIMTALVAGSAVSIALLICLLVFMASLSEPALRLPLIAGTTFAAMFLARVSPLGPAFFAAGFIIAYGLTFGDEVLGLSLQPGTVENNVDFALPEIAFVPPEEALAHFLLWLGLVVAMPVTLVILANVLTGRDPALVLRGTLARRLQTAARVCGGEITARQELTALAREGDSELHKLAHLSSASRRRETDGVLVSETGRLSLVLLAAFRLPADIWPASLLTAAAGACKDAAQATLDGTTLIPGQIQNEIAQPGNAAATPLLTELWRALHAIRAGLTVEPGPRPSLAKSSRKKTAFLAPDAFSNPAHPRFALKVTLAMLLCYALQDLTDWPGIHTCIITCFFVSLGTIGETFHKAALRLIGCLIGAALSLAGVLFLMPVMTDLGDLLLMVALVTFLAGWVATGSERSAYAGWQIGLAFYLTVLQGAGPTLDMETARDRIVGILLGNVVVSIIFTTMWPVSVGDTVRTALARAIEQLAGLLELQLQTDAEADAAEPGLRAAFVSAIEQARGVMVNDRYERPIYRTRLRAIDASTVLQVQALFVPVSVILGLRADPAWRALSVGEREVVLAHHRALAEWLRHCVLWIRTGSGAGSIAASLPEPRFFPGVPAGLVSGHLAARRAWYQLLDQDLRAILRQVGPQPPGRKASREAVHATA